MRISQPISNNGLYFGDKNLGNFETKGDITLPLEYGDYGYFFFENFVVNEGHTVTFSNCGRGFYIYVYGDAVINGTISVVDLGFPCDPNTEPEYENGYTPLGMENVTYLDPVDNLIKFETIKLPGYSDLAPKDTDAKVPGGCGGGRTTKTSSYTPSYKGDGGCASVFSGGSGAAMGWRPLSSLGGNSNSQYLDHYHAPAKDYGHDGGKPVNMGMSYSGSPAGGCGHPTWQLYVQDGARRYRTIGNYTPGVLYLVCRNKLKLGAKHLFDAHGHDGISGSTAPQAYITSGASGGGSITILYSDLEGTVNYNVKGGQTTFRTYAVVGTQTYYGYNYYHAGNGSMREFKIFK